MNRNKITSKLIFLLSFLGFMFSWAQFAPVAEAIGMPIYIANAPADVPCDERPEGCASPLPTQSGQELNDSDIDVSNNPIMKRLQQIVNFLSIGVGIVITMSVVFAGFQYITSRGDPAKTKAAVERVWNAGIAIFLYVFMYIIISWLIPGGV